MKWFQFLIFFTFFIGVYFLGNWYVFNRGAQALNGSAFRTVFPWVFWALASTFIIGQFLERGAFTYFSQVITYIGSFWLVFAWYALLMIIAIDLLRAANYLIPFISEGLKTNLLSGINLFCFVGGTSLLLVVFGAINAYTPRISKVEIQIDKPAVTQKEFKIVLVSDIHMGFIIGQNRTHRLVNKINKLNPDLVLMAGDIVDHNPKPVIRKDLGRFFLELKPKLGIYAIAGNHEYIGNPNISIDYLSQFGINYLRDSVVELDNSIVIVGRDEKDRARYMGDARKPVHELIKGIDFQKPVILLDHQPVEYSQVEKAGVDLMLSGHTHHGQFWPFGYITRRVYELDWGYLKKGNTNFYVSSGYGTWGPPVRIGSQSEIVEITLQLK